MLIVNLFYKVNVKFQIKNLMSNLNLNKLVNVLCNLLIQKKNILLIKLKTFKYLNINKKLPQLNFIVKKIRLNTFALS